MQRLENKATYIFAGSLLVIAIALVLYFANNIQNKVGESAQNVTTKLSMLLISPSFQNESPIPSKFTCDGGNINPELEIQNVPETAKSLALIMHDPDAPLEGGFTHWLIWNIDPKTTLIKQESKPAGSVEGLNGRKTPGYIGPCPPSGRHRYFFKLYALNAVLDLPETASKTDLETEIGKHLIEETELMGTYQRIN